MTDDKICPLRMIANVVPDDKQIPACIRERCGWWCNEKDKVTVTLPKGHYDDHGNSIRETWFTGVCSIKVLAVHTLLNQE